MPNQKRKVTLLFPTIKELIEFQAISELDGLYVDKEGLTISGLMTDREIELAFNAYEAKIVEANDDF